VSAKDKASGKEQAIEIKASSGLTETEVEQMIKEAESHAEEDHKQRQLIDARNQADQLVHLAEKSITEAGDSDSVKEKQTLQKAIDEVKDAIKGSDKTEIESKSQTLQEASSAFAQAKAQSSTTSSPAADSDDVLDTEFEEVDDK